MRKTSSWRVVARERIKRVGERLIQENPEATLEWLKSQISRTYPFGPRENYPYEVWRQELNSYIESLKPEESWYAGEVKAPKTWRRREKKPIPVVEGQLDLFNQEEQK